MKENEGNYILPDHRQEGMRSLKEMAPRREFQLSEEDRRLGEGKSFRVRTYGCQANVRDGETIAGILQEMGFTEALTEESADLLIFNTCAVRRNAEEHVLGEIGNLKTLKRSHPEKIFALCGCMAQEESVVKALQERYPQVDLVFGTHNLDRLPALLRTVMQEHRRVIEVYSSQGDLIEGLPARRSRRYKAFVNIMYGCNKFCTYCIVPYTRGRERSRSEEDILAEIRAFKAEGGREIQLLGQNVNAYGKDLGREDGFTSLLESAAATGIDRIRFYTSHPRDYSVTTIAAMQKYPNIMKALHLPVQSGSDEILKRMNRGYTADHFRELVGTMKKMIPEITLTTDLIVGFPSETDAQFEQTLKLVDDCEFDSAFTFIYSPREGTPAAAMKDDIPMAVKKQRLQILNERIGMHARARNEQYLHRQLEVLCDGQSRNNPLVMAGYSRENKLVNFTGEGIREGDLVLVEVTDAKSYSLDAKALQKI